MSEMRQVACEVQGGSDRILMGLRWSYVSIFLQGLLKAFVLILLSRLLGPREFGLLGYALLCTTFLERVGQIGVGPALVQQKSIDSDTVVTAHRISVVSGVFSTIIIWCSADALGTFFGEMSLVSILHVLSLGCLLEALAVVSDSMLQRELRFKEIAFADNAAYFFGMALVGVSLAALGCGVWSLVIATLVLKFVRLVVLRMYFSCPGPGTWKSGQAWTLMRMGIGFSLGRIFNFFSLQGDNFVVGRVLGVDALGMYSRAYQLMTLPAMYVGQIFERVMFPAMAQTQDSKERIKLQFLVSLEAIGLVALPAGVAMYLLSREIILVAFGPAWEPVIPVLSVLSFGVFFRTAYKCSDTLVRSLGAVYHYAFRQGLYTAMIVGGAWMGATSAGLAGVAVGVVVAIAINYLSMTRLSRAYIDLSWREVAEAHISGLCLSLWCGIGVYVSREYLRSITDHSAIHLIGASTVGVLFLVFGMVAMRDLIPSRVVPVVYGFGLNLARAIVRRMGLPAQSVS
jgi:O-antigen/teichoic acid export membrane protein